jgi:type IV secretory pathway VirB4 component
VAARGATHAEAEDGLRRLLVAADERMASLRPLRWRQATGTRAAGVIPGEVPGIRHLVPSSAVATLYPWTTADLWQRRGLHFGLNRVTGGLVAFDPFDQARFPNANIGILAQSGGGKTYLASILVSEARQRGAQVMVVDPEGEYRRLCASLDGQYVELGPGGPKSLNVLDRLSAGGEIEAALWDALDMIACICGHLDPGERAEMEIALRRLAAPKRAPTLSDLVREASRQTGLDRAVRLMRRWTEGALGEIFDRQSNVDPTCGFTVFGVRDLKDDLLPPAYALITSWLWHVVVNDPGPRLLLVDELGALFESPAARRFAVRVARRIRKYGGGFVFCTQNGRDILSGDEGRVIANNSAILFLGGQRGLEAAALEEAFELTPAQRRTLETANRGDFLLVAGEHRFPMRVMAADWQAPLIGGLAS